MKAILKFFLLMVLPVFLSAGCSKQGSPSANAMMNGGLGLNLLKDQINLLPNEELSVAEINSLMQMREEEKLARDVYKTLYAKWGINIFSNISGSEQNHMDAILMLIKKYALTDPVKSDEVGVFTSEVMQKLYKQLTELGNKSLPDALKVGATIEDLDLSDLQKWLTVVDNQDIIAVYGNLSRGSRNHLRAFNRNIVSAGGVYVPQYITQAAFDAIVNGTMETGRW